MTGAERASSRKVEFAAVEQGVEQVARPDHADDVVGRALGDRDSAVRDFLQSAFASSSSEALTSIQSTSVRGRHDLAHRPVGKADDAGDDRALAFLEDARRLGLGDDEVQFLRGHGVLGFAVEPEQLEDQRAGPVEQPDDRSRWPWTASASAVP